MMYTLLLAPFVEFDFMRRALVGLFALGLGAAPVGVFLTLRRMSLTGDAVAHAILPGVAVGFALAGFSVVAMTAGGLIAGFIVVVVSGIAARSTALNEDATLAAFYLVSLACGVMLVSARGSNVDLLHFLFGHVLALDDPSLLLIAMTNSLSLIVLALFYRPLVIDSVDPQFLSTLSRAGGVAHLVFLAVVVITTVGAIQALGTLLSVAAMILPAVAARFWTHNVNTMVLTAPLFGVSANIIGLLVSYHGDSETGPAIVLTQGLAVLLSLLFGRAGGLVPRLLRTRHRIA